MSNTEAFIDRLEAKIDNLKAENAQLRIDLATAGDRVKQARLEGARAAWRIARDNFYVGGDANFVYFVAFGEEAPQ